ncbi:HNH endonuclease [Acidithiobacillus sp.]|jgi:hypothetical protein|uniref:HNH endonuclease n=1 Tax=Acidithiobacillus sp. TaxID=1872118 RepID=UPI0025C10C2F|nr:HNH endonuclease [Acidithiobacillus sp.]MCK9187833.1 HNH endonuclease [Acidithiobacillus sp.]MCK9358723.1 HNH endonuclease [Acidithiobacillus sp.]
MTIDERLAFFEKNFDLIAVGTHSRGDKHFISDGKSRLCRFCQKDENETTFRNESHAIPECLGNHQLILLDECDECNTFFSNKLEDHLDKFTKPYRIAGQIAGKKGIPKYRTDNKKNRIEFNELPTVKSQTGEEFFLIDDKKKEITIKLHQEPHIPIAVYKALLKIAISVIKEKNELGAFRHTIGWLLNQDLTISVIKPTLLMQAFVPGPRPTNGVFVSLFRRKAAVSNVPYAIFVIAFGNVIFQLIVPSHIDDGVSMSVQLPFLPSPFEIIDWPYGDLKFGSHDLSGTEKVGRELSIVYSFEQMIEVDPKIIE